MLSEPNTMSEKDGPRKTGLNYHIGSEFSFVSLCHQGSSSLQRVDCNVLLTHWSILK